jgi:hypothetical protein
VKHPGCLIAGCIFLAAIAWLAWAIHRDRQLWSGFDEIKAGSTEREVLQKLGRPTRVEKCGEFYGPFPREELADCSKEYLYASPFSPLFPQYYVVRFDASNRVRSSIPLSSP